VIDRSSAAAALRWSALGWPGAGWPAAEVESDTGIEAI
jgi:hypothetical protein